MTNDVLIVLVMIVVVLCLHVVLIIDLLRRVVRVENHLTQSWDVEFWKELLGPITVPGEKKD